MSYMGVRVVIMDEERKKKIDRVLGKYSVVRDLMKESYKSVETQLEAAKELGGMGDLSEEEEKYFSEILDPIKKETEDVGVEVAKKVVELNQYTLQRIKDSEKKYETKKEPKKVPDNMYM